MYTKRNYGLFMTFHWSKMLYIVGFLYPFAIGYISYEYGYDISLPWQAVNIIAIAVAFYLGFKNNSSYDRTWESERIKNFPFPRQYASTAVWLNTVFCLFLPFSMLDFFPGEVFWLLVYSPLMSALLIWIYFLMEKIGDYSENPFEGSPNDVPITSIARGIEIDLREMIKDTDIPGPLGPENGFLL